MFQAFSASVLTASLTLTLGVSLQASASDSKPVQHAKEAGRDVKKSAKKAGNAVSDATCRTVNGKLECAAKEAGHKVENAAGEMKDAAVEPSK